MIISQNLCLEQVASQKKAYRWVRPNCPKCNHPCTGHGFVFRYFSGLIEALIIKRWRCKFCRIVITIRPNHYWRRYHDTIANIYSALRQRLTTHKWPPWASRQKGGHWLKSFLRSKSIIFGETKDLIKTLEHFEQKSLAIFV